jgi:hypothetical protein
MSAHAPKKFLHEDKDSAESLGRQGGFELSKSSLNCALLTFSSHLESEIKKGQVSKFQAMTHLVHGGTHTSQAIRS